MAIAINPTNSSILINPDGTGTLPPTALSLVPTPSPTPSKMAIASISNTGTVTGLDDGILLLPPSGQRQRIAIANSGLNLIDVAANGAYNLQLTVTNDVNRDGCVGGFGSITLCDRDFMCAAMEALASTTGTRVTTTMH